MFTFKIDGRTFDVGVSGIARAARIPDGPNSGEAKDGTYIRDVIGTFFDYTVTFNSTAGMTRADYDNLYEILTAPTDSHTLVVPYAQSTMTFQAYITDVSDQIIVDSNDGTIWGSLSVKFTAKSPQRPAEV